jgi:hypothetical protein
MAPEIAISQLGSLPVKSVVLDPMMGSGTVLRHAIQAGHHAIGFDMDPLAVLMSRVWSTPVSDEAIGDGLEKVERTLATLDDDFVLPWIDADPATASFVKFWFGKKQIRDLRRLAFVLDALGRRGDAEQARVADVLKIAMSRTIITKCDGASLAHDVSHSRPHRVMTTSNYQVLDGFRRSLRQVRERLKLTPTKSSVKASIGDARKPNRVRAASVDMVLTSPPYLNAIDYMRGHKLSLVWFGYSIGDLSIIRSESVGTERKALKALPEETRSVQMAMVDGARLGSRMLGVVERYSTDLVGLMTQVARVLKPDGKAIMVVGNSCLKGTFIKNSAGVCAAALASGLQCDDESIRALPDSSRYLPTPKSIETKLGKRMRTESILTFTHAA